MLAFFIFAPGKVVQIEGFDRVTAMDGVLHVLSMIHPGQVLAPPQSGAGRHGFAIVSGNSEEDVAEKFAHMQSAITITYED